MFLDVEVKECLDDKELRSYFEKIDDLTIRNKIIEHNLKLVFNEVKKFSNTPYDFDELAAVGLVGLIKSVDTFDVKKNIKFSSYSSKVICNEILMFLRKERKYINNISFDELYYIDDGSFFQLEDYFENRELYDEIRNALDILSDRERTFIMLFYGFNAKPMSQTEIADMFNLSQSYVSRVIRYSLQKILKYLKTNHLFDESYIDKYIKK